MAHQRADLQPLTVNPHDRRHTEASGRRSALLYHRRRLINAAALGLGDGLALIAAMLLAGATRWGLFGAPMIPWWSLLLLPSWWLGRGRRRWRPRGRGWARSAGSESLAAAEPAPAAPERVDLAGPYRVDLAFDVRVR